MADIDYFTEKGAALLAERVRRYWLKRGYLVEVWTDSPDGSRAFRGPACGVRSNLVNGLPPAGSKVQGVAA